ncbi:MerC domain-containing protein [Bernardetia sp.]|uniref:MerC domain-containing protein n=1 Tax=Bernardetia sp. TaxID=1937974 RepID=UPI0025BAA839|nr:MerC domain-containing protein [Bernardetia sp.]
MRLSFSKPDAMGALASTMCLIHCIATPFIFVAHSCAMSCCEVTPIWWKWIDYFFLVISFLSIYQSTRTSSNDFVKYGLWINWVILLVVLVNESLEIFALPKITIYVVALSLASLHLYNLNYCQCKNEKCCTNYE